MATIVSLYNLEEVAEHNTVDDCWVIINGKVYDVTRYLDEHPGGTEVLLAATGKDATEDFEDVGHSQDARNLMKDYYIGDFDALPQTTLIPELEITKNHTTIRHLLEFRIWQYCTMPAILMCIVVATGVLYMRKK